MNYEQTVNEADQLLRELGLDPSRFRSEGGLLNFGKIKAALKNPSAYAGLYLFPNACTRCGVEDWRPVTSQGGAMDVCENCGKTRWHKPANTALTGPAPREV